MFKFSVFLVFVCQCEEVRRLTLAPCSKRYWKCVRRDVRGLQILPQDALPFRFIMHAYANPCLANPNMLLIPRMILTQSGCLARSVLTMSKVYDLPVLHGSTVRRSQVKRSALPDQKWAYVNLALMLKRDGSRGGPGLIRGIKVNGKEESETLQPLCSPMPLYQRVGFSLILFMFIPRDGWNTAHTRHH